MKAVLSMDIPKERVKKAIRNRLAENGKLFCSIFLMCKATSLQIKGVVSKESVEAQCCHAVLLLVNL